MKVAAALPTGPVYLSLPSDLLGQAIDTALPAAERFKVVPRMAADPQALQDAARLLATAKRPVIVAGSGVARAAATQELIELAERVAAPVVMEPRYSFLVFRRRILTVFR